jgi:hypothetical protein
LNTDRKSSLYRLLGTAAIYWSFRHLNPSPWRHNYWGRFHRSCTTKDEGIEEALLRDAEFEENPSLGMTLEELEQRIENRRS